MSKLSLKFQGFKRRGNIWQLFRATDFQSLMYPCFTFCRILGIFPYKINISTIKSCKRCYILSTIIICILCICEVINFSDSIIPNLKNVPRIIELYSFYIFGGFIAIITFILSGPRMRLLQTILEVSLKLPQESYQNLSRLIHAKDIFGFFLLSVQASIHLPYMRFSVLCKITALYIFLLVYQMDMLYMNCVCVLKACFKQINDNLANLQKFMVSDETYHLRGTYYKQRNPFLLMGLKALQKQYLAISDTVQMLKIIFSLQLLSSISITFTQITFNLYFYLMHIHTGTSLNNYEKQVYFDYLIISTIYNFTKISLIVWACETGKNQAVEINTTVHNVLNNTSDKQIKYELQLFSLQLMHCKNVFSAKCFIVDSTLLNAMVGSITTYLLLLVQFLFIFNSCKGKSKANIMI